MTTLPNPFLDDSSSDGIPMNNGYQNGGMPPPQNDTSDSEDELQKLQAAYNSDHDAMAMQTTNDEDDATPPPPMFSNSFPTDEPPKSPPNENNITSPNQLNDSTTNGTPEPNSFYPPPPPSFGDAAINEQEQQQPNLHRNAPPPPPAFCSKPPSKLFASSSVPPPPSLYTSSSSPSSPDILKRKIPKRERSGRNKNPPPPKMHSNHIIHSSEPHLQLGINDNNNNIDYKQDMIDRVSFTDILRQIDVGVEMTDRLKEVIRKFCKHQQMGADKLQEIYGKLPSTYQETDGMADFADLCALVHTLILETVSAQKRLADFLFKDVVPKMDTYIKEKQQQIQQLKRDNQQSEMKLKNSINSMNKASNTAKVSANKAKQMASQSHTKKRQYGDNTHAKKKGGGIGGVFKKFKHNQYADLPEEEQAYLKAQTNQKNYEAAVMAANYEQDTYNKIQARFKRDCKGLEQQRLQYCHQKIQQFINAHRSYFNNETIMVLQTRILSGLDSLDSNREFESFLERTGSTHRKKKDFIAEKYDYQNVFHSLQDSMDITSKLAPHSKLPLMLTSLCNKVRELNGFDTEGIFRKSAMATEIDRLKIKLSGNDYMIDTKDPHVAACLLKDWLRGLKDSLIPQTHYDIAIQMARKNEIKQESLEVFLSQLPEVNRETIKYLVKFLKDLIEDKHIRNTKMNLENVAIVFAPTILKCPHSDSKVLLANSKHEKSFTIALIQELSTYYNK